MGLYKIVIDAMGSDGSPEVEVLAAMEAVSKHDDLEITLVGKEEEIGKYLTAHDRIKVLNARDVITNNDDATRSIRRKKDASVVVALNQVKEGHCDAIVSAGATGAYLTGATLILGRIEGVRRPALSPIVESFNGRLMSLIDVGATPDPTPEMMVQNAVMGQVFIKVMAGTQNPTVGLINNGAEAKKGNELTKAVYKLLENDERINFVGSVEAREALAGNVDVLVMDGWTGNILIKSSEGLGLGIFDLVKQNLNTKWYYKLAGAIIYPALRSIKKKLDYSEIGGATLVGTNGVVVKTHGSSDSRAFYNAIRQARFLCENEVLDKIKDEINK